MDGNRMDELIETVSKAAAGDYSIRLGLLVEDDRLDRLIKGVNMLIADLQKMEEKQEQFERKLKETADDFFWQSEELKSRNEEFKAYSDLLRKQKQEMERLAREAEEASVAKSEFLANMSHEIRTPMNGVIGFAEMLMDTELTAEQKEYVKTINRSGESLLVIINDILDFSRMEAGDITFEEIEFDAEQLVYDVCDLIRPKLDKKPVEIIYNITTDIPVLLKGDPHRLRQVLLNLIGNAVKFTKEGKIKVSLSIDKKEDNALLAHFKIRDTGVGIPEDKIESVFEFFSQADSSTTRKFGGTGLGLTISRKISRKFGGDCWVESELGKGSIFHITGWFGVGDETTIFDQVIKESELADKKILIVDDSQLNRELLEKVLSLYGIKTTSSSSGKEALQILEGKVDFDLIILDISMPEVDGYQLYQEMKSRYKLNKIRFLAYSSVGGDSFKQCKELGFDGYLPKPAGRKKIINMIRKIFGLVDNDGKRILTQYKTAGEEIADFSAMILLAEDNPVNQMVAKKMLEKMGHQVDVAKNGWICLDMFKKSLSVTGDKGTKPLYDIIFMDMQMPEMGGVEATKEIRKFEESFVTNGKSEAIHIPIIAMTANVLDEHRDLCFSAGMNDFIAKPTKKDELQRLVLKWMDKS